MDWQKIEQLVDKYFEGTTSLEEERVLKNYFSQEDVADELKQFQPLFCYLQVAKEETAPTKTALNSKKSYKKWFSVAAAFILISGLTTIWNLNTTDSQDLGTFDDPKIAYAETLKALELLASNVNYGMESVNYINEYEYSKNLIFKN